MTNQIKLLLVEDDYEDYLFTQILLKDAQYTNFIVDWAKSVEEGLSLFKTNQYDVCLVDFILGEADGLEFLERAGDQKQRTSIIFLTGMRNPELDQKAMQNEASDYLVKGSFDADLLERTIIHAIDRKKQNLELTKTKNKLQQAITELEKNHEERVQIENLKSVQQLAGAVAHEFSQPLQALLNYVSLSKMENPDYKYADEILAMAKRISELTENLRKITNLEKIEYVGDEIIDLKNSAKTKKANKGSILIVEDEQAILDTFLDMFQLQGYVCDSANNGAEALEKTNKKKYNLIISDINMPEMNGAEFFKRFKKTNQNTPFIFITGYELTSEIKNIVQDADAVVNKPIDFAEFLELIENLHFSRN